MVVGGSAGLTFLGVHPCGETVCDWTVRRWMKVLLLLRQSGSWLVKRGRALIGGRSPFLWGRAGPTGRLGRIWGVFPGRRPPRADSGLGYFRSIPSGCGVLRSIGVRGIRGPRRRGGSVPWHRLRTSALAHARADV